MSEKRYIAVDKLTAKMPILEEDREYLVLLSDVRKAIAQTPTENVVEAVRCRDCRESQATETEDVRYCFLWHDCRKGHDFCSYGKGANDTRFGGDKK